MTGITVLISSYKFATIVCILYQLEKIQLIILCYNYIVYTHICLLSLGMYTSFIKRNSLVVNCFNTIMYLNTGECR